MVGYKILWSLNCRAAESRPLTRRAAIFPALAAGLIALGAISSALAQDGSPTEAAPASGAASASVASSAIAVAPTPAAPAAEPSTLVGGPKTFLINDSAPDSTVSGWFPIAPAAPAPGAPREPAAAAVAGVPAPPIDAPTAEEQSIGPDEAPLRTAIIPSAAQQALQSGTASQGAQVVSYEAQSHGLKEFGNEEVNASPLGVELQEGARRTKNGREVDGLLVVALQPDSPAERAGVRAGHPASHDVLEGAAVVASLVFPPAVLAVPVIETIQFGENYDLIIGVDGNRVTNFMDFQDRLCDAQPGEIVYLNILRGGKRLQVPVEMPYPGAAKLEP